MNVNELADAYLELLAEALTGVSNKYETFDVDGNVTALMPNKTRRLFRRARRQVSRLNNELSFLGERRSVSLEISSRVNSERRAEGQDWAADGYTMVGMKRLRSMRPMVERIEADRISGDIIETGVWRGGASIYLKGVLRAIGNHSRHLYLCDSFQGMPIPGSSGFSQDKFDFSGVDFLSVSADQVRSNFARFDLLDDRVHLVEGWFHETLPKMPTRTYALIRLDGDLYSSTMLALEHLYPHLAAGGYIVIDDYGDIAECQQAVSDYRDTNGISTQVEFADTSGAWWRKEEA